MCIKTKVYSDQELFTSSCISDGNAARNSGLTSAKETSGVAVARCSPLAPLLFERRPKWSRRTSRLKRKKI